MISVSDLYSCLQNNGINFFTGIPDSLLKEFCLYIAENVSDKNHIIASNEGGAIGIATGYYLATGKVPLVYLQNSGIGNTINPLVSLADKEVYGIPIILLIGWRGEPGVKDEPQHIKQGRIQNKLLESLEIPYKILNPAETDLKGFIEEIVQNSYNNNSAYAIIVRKNSFNPFEKSQVEKTIIEREAVINLILNAFDKDEIFVSTTGMISRELYEIRRLNNQTGDNDFLTVGSMGHSSQIALGIALKLDKKVICIDGDGSAIMHMGSLAIIGSSGLRNYIHIVLNNGAHDSVGGQPTVGLKIDFAKIALACGYKYSRSITSYQELLNTILDIKNVNGPIFLEIKVSKGARKNLGRPKELPSENKLRFMKKIQSI